MAREKTPFHFARYEKSERLQKLLAFMMHGEERTTREIDRAIDICAVGSAAAELRANLFDFRCIKRSRPAVYQLFDVDGAKARAAALLATVQ